MVIKAGDSIPRSSLQEKAPNDKVDLAEEIGSGNALIIGVSKHYACDCRCVTDFVRRLQHRFNDFHY